MLGNRAKSPCEMLDFQRGEHAGEGVMPVSVPSVWGREGRVTLSLAHAESSSGLFSHDPARYWL